MTKKLLAMQVAFFSYWLGDSLLFDLIDWAFLADGLCFL